MHEGWEVLPVGLPVTLQMSCRRVACALLVTFVCHADVLPVGLPVTLQMSCRRVACDLPVTFVVLLVSNSARQA